MPKICLRINKTRAILLLRFSRHSHFVAKRSRLACVPFRDMPTEPCLFCPIYWENITPQERTTCRQHWGFFSDNKVMNTSLSFRRVTWRDKSHFSDYLALSRFTVHGRQRPPTAADLDRVLIPEGYEAQLTYHDKVPVGLIEYYFEGRGRRRILTLDAVAIAPEFRGRGFALASCLHFLDFARENQIKFCRFSYLNAPMRALAWRLIAEPRYFNADPARKQELFRISQPTAGEFFDLLIKVRPAPICTRAFQHSLRPPA